MSASYPDLAVPLRDAILDSSIADLLPVLNGDPTVYTRRPVPLKSPPIMVIVGPDFSDVDRGGLTDQRLSIKRDIAIYGPNDTAGNYRLVEEIARGLRDTFHRNPAAITVADWKVVQIWARGPFEMSVDTPDKDVARGIELTIELSAEM